MGIRKLLVFLVLLSSIATAPAIAHAFGEAPEKDPEKYEKLFYPKGVPSIIGFDKVERPAKYHFIYEATVSNTDLSVVLFAVEGLMGPNVYGEYEQRTAHVAVIKNGSRILYEKMISKHANVTHIGGTVRVFIISANMTGVDLYVWEGFPGSGGATEGADYFYRLNKEAGRLSAVLKLTGTTYSSRLGADAGEAKHTQIYIGDIDNDGMAEILTRLYTLEIDDRENIHDEELSDSIDIYKYNKTKKKYLPSGQLKEMPKNAIELSKPLNEYERTYQKTHNR